MSTGKRLAKRSILGTRVACWLENGMYYPGVICDVRIIPDNGPTVYSVRIEGERKSRDLREGDLVGNGFTPVISVKLKVDQAVFITYNQREIQGSVIYHRPNIDEVLISIVNPETGCQLELKKRLEEVRLLESRKSARLADQDTDFAKLADCVSDRACSRKISSTIDVPGIMQSGSRKRRSSRNEDDLTDECAAALVLMKLSCSPRSPALHEAMMPMECSSGASSVSSGVWSLSGVPGPKLPTGARSATPSPPLSDSSPPPFTADDGIDLDDIYEDVPRKRRSSTRTMFKCTWTECCEIAPSCHEIEQHIRGKHLGRKVVNSDSEYDSDDDHEEEFYWREVEVNVATNVDRLDPLNSIIWSHQSAIAMEVQKDFMNAAALPPTATSAFVSRKVHTPIIPKQMPLSMSPFEPSAFAAYTFISPPPTLSHMDMARPPHEDPDYLNQRTNSPSILSSSWPRSTYVSPGKIKARALSSPKGGGRGKRNGESRKCRKVYGMEQKDQWCTQCKWKKACSRFSE